MRFDLLVLDDAHHLADTARWRCSLVDGGTGLLFRSQPLA
jgi:hypothetical protein